MRLIDYTIIRKLLEFMRSIIYYNIAYSCVLRVLLP